MRNLSRRFAVMAFAFAPAALVLSGTVPRDVQAQTAVRTQTVVAGLDFPWAFAPITANSGLITERDGRLLYWDGQRTRALQHGLDIEAVGQGGLLDVLWHAPTSSVFLTYSKGDRSGANTALARGRLLQNATGMVLAGMETIFEAAPKTRGGRHFGSRLALGSDGKIYMTLGDRGDFMDEAQNPGNHIGTILRLNLDGSVPADNPFVGQPNVRPEIYSYGHRNPQGLAVRPADGALWSHEHGPRGGDELNKIARGANYGWPKITYGIDYDGSVISNDQRAPGMEQPVIYWSPSIAPSGMAFKNDKVYVGALRGRHLRELTLQGDQVVANRILLKDLGARVRDVRTGPDGQLFVLTDDSAPDGALIKVFVD